MAFLHQEISTFKVNATLSVKSLFQKNLMTTQHLEESLEQSLCPSELAEWRYLVGLIKEKRQWKQYISKFPNHSLCCIKTNSNPITNEAGVPHRLFFLVNNTTHEIIILVNKRISGNHHNVRQHYETINQHIRNISDDNGAILQVQQPHLYQFPAEAKNASPTTITTDKSKSIFYDSELTDQVINELNTKPISNRMIVNAVQQLANVICLDLTCDEIDPDIHENASKQASKLVETFCQQFIKRNLMMSLSNDENKLYLHVQCKNEGNIYTFPITCSNDPYAIGKRIVQHIIDYDSQQPNGNHQPLYEFLFNAYEYKPETILQCLNNIPSDKFPKSRAWVNYLVNKLESDVDHGTIGPKDYILCLMQLHKHQCLHLVDPQNTRAVCDILLHAWATLDQDITADSSAVVNSDTNSTTASATPIASATQSTSAMRMLRSLNNTKQAQNIQLQDLISIMSTLMPMLRDHDLLRFIENNADAIASPQKIDILFDAFRSKNCQTQFQYFLVMLNANPNLQAHINQSIIKILYEKFANSSSEVQHLCYQSCYKHKNVMDLPIMQPFLQGYQAWQQNRIDESSSLATKTSKTQKKSESKEAIEKKEQQVVKPNLRANLQRCLSLTPRTEQECKGFMKAVSKVLQPYIVNNELKLPESDEQFFINSFLINLKRNGSVYNLLQIAVQENNVHLSNILLKYCNAKDPELITKHNRNCVDIAAFRCHAEVLELLLGRYNFDPNELSSNGVPPMHRALLASGNLYNRQNRVLDTLNVILSAGGDINIVPNLSSDRTSTALSHACWQNMDKRIIKLLLKRGADPNIRFSLENGEYYTALDLLRAGKNYDIATEKLMLAHGAELGCGICYIQFQNGRPATQSSSTQSSVGLNYVKFNEVPAYLQKIIKKQRRLIVDYYNKKISAEQIIKHIQQKELCVNVSSLNHLSFIHFAIMRSDIDFVLKLLPFQPNLNINATHNPYFEVSGTALHFAIRYGLHDLIAPMIQAGASMTICDDNKRTPFHVCLLYGQVEMIRTMIREGYDINTETGQVQNKKYGLAEYCANINNREMMRFVLMCNKNHDYQPSLGFRLRQAIRALDLDEVKRLVALGADINEVSEDANKETALHLACRHHFKDKTPEIINYLLSLSDIKADVKNSDGFTPLKLYTLNHKFELSPGEPGTQKSIYYNTYEKLSLAVSRELRIKFPKAKIFFDISGEYQLFEDDVALGQKLAEADSSGINVSSLALNSGHALQDMSNQQTTTSQDSTLEEQQHTLDSMQKLLSQLSSNI